MSDLTDFVLARLAEDEANPWCGGAGEYWSCTESSDQRVLDVKAKRTFIERVAPKMEIDPGSEWARLIYVLAIKTMAAPYADHKDFNPAWSLTD